MASPTGTRGISERLRDTRLGWAVYRALRKVWVRVAAFALLAVATVAGSQGFGPLVPEDLAESLGADAVDQVLTIMASSMLAVTTFSLSISVSAFASAATEATPRATALLQEDRTAQNVLGTFLGAFAFSLTGLVALKAGYYSAAGRLVLFTATVLVIVLVLIAFIRWIGHLTNFGRMVDTLDRVEDATRAAVEARMAAPWLGGVPASGPPPEGSVAVASTKIGYVQHIDMGSLSEIAGELGALIRLDALPGSFVHPGTPLVHVAGAVPDSDARERILASFTAARGRSFEQDPGYGLIVLSEIASRALSPAVNDPGTATDVLVRIGRVLTAWRADVRPRIDHARIVVPTLGVEAMLAPALGPILREGGRYVEVQLKLQEVLSALAAEDRTTFGEVAARWSRAAREAAREAGLGDEELAALEARAPG